MNHSELIDHFYSAIRSGDVATITQCIHADFTLNWQGSSHIPWAGTWKGVDGLLDFFAKLNEHVDVLDVSVEQSLDNKDISIVILQGKWRMCADKALIEASAANLFTFQDERIAGYTVINDSEAFANAL